MPALASLIGPRFGSLARVKAERYGKNATETSRIVALLCREFALIRKLRFAGLYGFEREPEQEEFQVRSRPVVASACLQALDSETYAPGTISR